MNIYGKTHMKTNEYVLLTWRRVTTGYLCMTHWPFALAYNFHFPTSKLLCFSKFSLPSLNYIQTVGPWCVVLSKSVSYWKFWSPWRPFSTFFTLTCPNGSGATLGWLSFWPHVDWKVFNLYENSYHNFKEVYFKICSSPGSTPFFLIDLGSLKFPYYWNKKFHVPHFSKKGLDPIDEDIVDFFFAQWGEKTFQSKENFEYRSWFGFKSFRFLFHTVFSKCFFALSFLCFYLYDFPLLSGEMTSHVHRAGP